MFRIIANWTWLFKMATDNVQRRPTSPEKYDIRENEHVSQWQPGAHRRESVKHGDRALALIGDERVFLSEEDVG